MGRYSGLITGKTTRTPSDYQKQPTAAEPKPRKYRNVKVARDGYTFDSKAEAKRYEELVLLQRAGTILNLRVHPSWEILPTLRVAGKRTLPARKYAADFSYNETKGTGLVVEDVKGVRTPVYRLKVQMFLAAHPEIDFREVDA